MGNRLVACNDPILHKPCKEVTDFDCNIHMITEDMRIATMGREILGIAAPQIGVDAKIVIAHLKNGGKFREEYVLINPHIELYGPRIPSLESCLSTSALYLTRRSFFSHVCYFTPDGFHKHLKLSGWDSIIAQHEIDHLEGKLISGTGIPLTADYFIAKAYNSLVEMAQVMPTF